ncbi:MAG: hypothetical protein C4575_13665 [Desulforudis sp.]|nr:MAG: hypothetical protein C4575_13665 [Desulforudis sp.]
MSHDRIVLLIDRYARSLSGRDLAAFADILDREAYRVRCPANVEGLRKPGRGPFLERGSAETSSKT